jgi:hypothetical protein
MCYKPTALKSDLTILEFQVKSKSVSVFLTCEIFPVMIEEHHFKFFFVRSKMFCVLTCNFFPVMIEEHHFKFFLFVQNVLGEIIHPKELLI